MFYYQGNLWGGPSEPSNGPNNHFGANKNRDDWGSSNNTSAGTWDRPRGGGAPGGDPMMGGGRNETMSHRGNEPGGWGPPPQRQPVSQWGSNSGGPSAPGAPGSGSRGGGNLGGNLGGNTWDLESPNMPRRPVDDGTGHWGKPAPGSGGGNSGNVSAGPAGKPCFLMK